MAGPLTSSQRRVLEFLREFVTRRRFAPTAKEIAAEFGIAEKNAFYYLDLLERKGHIRRRPHHPRLIEFTGEPLPPPPVRIPVLGRVPAGSPREAIEVAEEELLFDPALAGGGDLFSLRVKGDSMVGAHIGEGACALALRALARPLLRGEAVAAVDGGNRFDPYEISKAARALGGDGREALLRIRVSRAFTCHQMEALLAHRLSPALARFDARLALVVGLPETFTDADVPYAEACRIFRGCLSALRRIASGGVRVVLVGRGERPEDKESGRAGFFR